ncbi:MAG: hypothetical protein R2795_05045 [Saprospiraceae bacterium]
MKRRQYDTNDTGMLYSLLVAIIGIVSIALLWVVVQLWWKKSFTEYISDDDVLAERRDCGNCGCTTACKRR